MKPVMMTSFGWPDGNCFAACMASIFEVPLEELPAGATAPLQPGEGLGDWIKPWNEWLRPRGMALVACDAWMVEVDGVTKMADMPGFSILSCAVLGAPMCADGTELRHAVVARDGRIVHNPKPGSEGKNHELWPREFQYFIVLDPTKLEPK